MSDWCDEETDACVHLGADRDGDGICDIDDACPDSDPTPTIVIDECDSGVGNHLFDNGCTMQDQLAECEVSTLNHGQYVRCVAKVTNRWKSQGLITGAQKGLIQSCAAQADIPRLAPREGK